MKSKVLTARRRLDDAADFWVNEQQFGPQPTPRKLLQQQLEANGLLRDFDAEKIATFLTQYDATGSAEVTVPYFMKDFRAGWPA